MKCVFCKDEHAEPLALVTRPENLEQVFSCIPCATQQGVWCTRHDRARVGLYPRCGTVCMQCVDADVMLHTDEASGICIKLLETLPYAEWRRIMDWMVDMTHAWRMAPEAIVLRGVLMEAHRRGVTHWQIVEEVCAAQSADAILPHAY